MPKQHVISHLNYAVPIKQCCLPDNSIVINTSEHISKNERVDIL